MAKQKQPVTVRAFEQICETLESGIDIHRCVAATAIAQINQAGSTQALEKALLDEDEDVRVDVVEALATLKDPKSAKAVMENLLGDPVPEVKIAAIGLLSDLDYQPVIPVLLKMAAGNFEDINLDQGEFFSSGWDDTLVLQAEAIRALGKMAVTEAVDPILQALNDEFGQDISHIAIPALGNMKQEGLSALEGLLKQGSPQLRRRICESLNLNAAPKSDEMIAACLKDEDGGVRLAALEKYIEADINDNRIVKFYDDEDADIRQLVVESIGAKVPAKINQLLSDPSPLVRQAAFRAIAAEPERFEKEGFSEVVRKAIAGVPEVAGDAAIAWAVLIGEPSAQSLGNALQNDKQPIGFRMGLIQALTLLDDAGFPYLAQAAGDQNRQVRVSALTALAEIAKETSWPNNASETLFAALTGDLVEPPADSEDAESETSDAETDNVETDNVEARDDEPDGEKKASEQVIEDKSLEPDSSASQEQQQQKPVVEKQAVSTLEQMMSKGIQTEAQADPDAEEDEVELTEEDDRFIEISKMRAMKKGKVSLDVKVAPHQDVRQFSARLLGDFVEKGVPESLVAALAEDDDELKQSCLDSLAVIGKETGKIKKKLYKPIAKETENQDRGIRMAATRCLGFIVGDDVTERLNEICSDKDVHVRLEAFRALTGRKGQTQAMEDALLDEYSGVRTVAIKALGAEQQSMEKLIELSFKHDGMHLDDIVSVMKNWNAQQAAEIYLNVVKDEARKRDWLVAIKAIGELLAPQQHNEIQAVA